MNPQQTALQSAFVNVEKFVSVFGTASSNVRIALRQGTRDVGSRGGVAAVQYNIDPDAERERHRMELEKHIGSSPQPRFQSPVGEDPDLLRNLVQQSRGVPLNVQRITTQELKALKTTARKEAGIGVSITRSICGVFGGIFTALGSVFSARTKKPSQCQLYGHVIQKGGWTGVYPKCIHCGTEITSEDQLKGTSARPVK